MMEYKSNIYGGLKGNRGKVERSGRSFHPLATASPSSSPGGSGRNKSRKMPEKGFFADVDPNATIYPVKGNLQQDPTKRGGRYESDFIWNSNWKEALEYEESLKRQQKSNQQQTDTETNDGPGKLSLTSKIDLNDINVDLSKQLMSKKKAANKIENIPKIPTTKAASTKQKKVRKGYAPNPSTQREAKAWSRSDRYARKGPVAASQASLAAEEELEKKKEDDRIQFERLKRELQMWNLGLTAGSLACTYVFYGRDVAASYGVGALGGLFYLRSLSRSMDSLGVGGGGGGPRLLIPVILALGYNRYNTLVSATSGLELQLLPMLVGFFTYKGAVIARQSLALFSELSSGYDSDGDADKRDESDALSKKEDALRVDRAFTKNILTK